ncbi:MAG: hypothetical protein J7M18_05585 [Candidatus Eremiobacteraeota bacterium]|nr:hypothetical protein [Candidatus Eremiobacteraeota bacterium]
MKCKFLVTVFLAILFSIFFAGCAYSPGQILGRMKKTMLEIDSMHFKGKCEGISKYKDQKIGLSLEFEGDATEMTSVEKCNITTDNELSVSLGGISLNFGVNTRIIGNNFYIRANKIPGAIPFVKGKFTELLMAIQGKWVKFDITSLRQKRKMNREEIAELKDKVKREFMKTKLSKDINVLEKEKIDGFPCHHYLITLDKTKMANFLYSINQMKVNWMRETGKDPGKIKKTEKSLDEIREKLARSGDIVMEVWIDQKDFYLRKLKTVVFVSPSFISEKIRMPVEMCFSDFNKPVTMVEPGDALTFPEFIVDIIKIPRDKIPDIKLPFLKGRFPFDLDKIPLPDNLFKTPGDKDEKVI